LFTVGFAAETDKLAEYAQAKMQSKSLDMVAANWVGDGKGFAVDNNALEVFWQDGHSSLPLTDKTQLAQDLMTLITEHYYAKNSTQDS
jgi:phosphopantothenoylcysteine decarboxylase/phosphopantothenate--cysteine ligase